MTDERQKDTGGTPEWEQTPIAETVEGFRPRETDVQMTGNSGVLSEAQDWLDGLEEPAPSAGLVEDSYGNDDLEEPVSDNGSGESAHSGDDAYSGENAYGGEYAYDGEGAYDGGGAYDGEGAYNDEGAYSSDSIENSQSWRYDSASYPWTRRVSYVDSEHTSYIMSAPFSADQATFDDAAPYIEQHVEPIEGAPASTEYAAYEVTPTDTVFNEGIAFEAPSDTIGTVEPDRESVSGGKRRASSPFDDDERLDPYPTVARGPRGIMIVIAVLAMIALAMAAYVFTTGVLGSGMQAKSNEGIATTAGVAAGELIQAVATQGTAARDEALEGGWLATKTVCIDAGHGARADLTLTPIGPGSSEMQYVEPGGAAGVVTGRGEYEVTLEVALLLQEKLENAGVNVVMVRTTNDVVMSSEDRAAIANECDADLFVRLHADGADDSSVRGFSTLVPGLNQWTADIVESSAYAAQVIHPIIIEETGAKDRGIVERLDLAGFNFCEVPSILMEMGYMSNPEEDRLLNDPEYQDLLAEAICDGIIAYLEATS